MGRHQSASADLATKFAVGEIVDMAGVPAYFDAGSSQWMQGNVWFAATAVAAAVLELLRRNPGNTALTTQTVALAAGGGITPASIGAVTVLSTVGQGPSVLLVNEAGTQLVNTGMAADVPGVQVVSDGAYFYAFGMRYGIPQADTIKRSVDGGAWATPPGGFSMNAIYASTAYSVYEMGWSTPGSYPSSGEVDARGQWHGQIGGQNASGVLYCGARFLVIAPVNSNDYVGVWRCTDGMAWGNNDAATVLGNANLSLLQGMHFHRNGLKCLLMISTPNGNGAWRYTADGGVTWAASTVVNAAGAEGPNSTRKRINTSQPDKVAFVGAAGMVSITTDCGTNFATRSAAITGISNVAISAYKGTRLFLVNSQAVVTSNDDGATWAPFSLPAGFAGSVQSLVSDDTNFYLQSSTGQLFVSADGATWLQRSLPATTGVDRALRLNASQILLVGTGGYGYVSNDGGVTWAYGLLTPQSGSGAYSRGPLYKLTTGATVRALAAGGGAVSGTLALVTPAAMTAGAAMVRASQNSPTALRGSTTPMIRVG